MPVNAFPGARNWGYDGVFPFATQASYGGPTGLARLVDAAHAKGLGVVLDVVYNHFGPEGNVLPRFGPYLTDDYSTPGAERSTSRVETATRSDDTSSRTPSAGSPTSTSTASDSTPSTRSSTPRLVPFVAELTAAVHRAADEAGRTVLVTIESSANDARIVRRTSTETAGAATPSGTTTSTTRCGSR